MIIVSFHKFNLIGIRDKKQYFMSKGGSISSPPYIDSTPNTHTIPNYQLYLPVRFRFIK